MTDALSSHYAAALANAVFAADAGLSPADASEQLHSAAALFTESKELERALLSPAINRVRKQEIVNKFADQLGLHRLIRNFLLVVVSHRRIKELQMIQQSFDIIVDERSGWIPADIISAHELSVAQREEIERALGSKLGKYIRARYKVDPSLIGGIRTHVAAKEYDATVRGKLESMRSHLEAHL